MMTAAKLSKEYLGLAAEFAVASELCRRGMYAQLTLGTRKRTDLLVETEAAMLSIQVKAKQKREWPNCKGIFGQNRLLVFVDFQDKFEDQRPDFYILTAEDWKNIVMQELKDYIAKGDIVIDKENVPVWVKQVNKSGQPYKGMSISVIQVRVHKEDWDTIRLMVGQ